LLFANAQNTEKQVEYINPRRILFDGAIYRSIQCRCPTSLIAKIRFVKADILQRLKLQADAKDDKESLKGTKLKVDGQTIIVQNKLAEGGFAVVYKVLRSLHSSDAAGHRRQANSPSSPEAAVRQRGRSSPDARSTPRVRYRARTWLAQEYCVIRCRRHEAGVSRELHR